MQCCGSCRATLPAPPEGSRSCPGAAGCHRPPYTLRLASGDECVQQLTSALCISCRNRNFGLIWGCFHTHDAHSPSFSVVRSLFPELGKLPIRTKTPQISQLVLLLAGGFWGLESSKMPFQVRAALEGASLKIMG